MVIVQMTVDPITDTGTRTTERGAIDLSTMNIVEKDTRNIIQDDVTDADLDTGLINAELRVVGDICIVT